MKVLDTTFLIDYGRKVDATAEYLLEHTDERFVVPTPVLLEYLLGAVHSQKETELTRVESELSWVEVAEIDRHTVRTAAAVADEIEPQGPQLTAVDAIVAGVGREVDGTVVSADNDLTHAATRQVISIDNYR